MRIGSEHEQREVFGANGELLARGHFHAPTLNAETAVEGGRYPLEFVVDQVIGRPADDGQPAAA